MSSFSSSHPERQTEDYLDEDPAVRGQNFVCMSFLSPDDVIVKKEAWIWTRFLGHLSKDINTMLDNISATFPDFAGNVRSIKERHSYLSSAREMNEEYQQYYGVNFKELEDAYLAENGFQSSMRGIKIRGVYNTEKEAQQRVATIKKFDRSFNVYVGQVGMWLPWAPPSASVESQEYQERELQEMMRRYKENEDLKDHFFTTRKEMMLNTVPDPLQPQVFVTTDEGEQQQEGQEERDPWLESKSAAAATAAATPSS